MQFKEVLKVQSLIDFCGPLIDSSLGDTSRTVAEFTTPTSKKDNSFAFINNDRLLETVETSAHLTCILAPANLKDKVLTLNSKKVWLFSKNVDLCACNIKRQFVFPTPFRADFNDIHPTAIIADNVTLGTNVTIAPYAIIGKNCSIGDNSFIGAHSVIEENTLIKNNVTIHPHAYIGHSCEIGNDCEIMPQAIVGSEGYGYAHDHLGNHYRIPHTGKVILHDDVHVGAGTAIDRGTITDSVIGKGTKFDNQCHLAHNSVVGENGLITAQFVMAGSSTLGNNFMSGGKAAVTGHVTVTDNVHIAGLAAITNDVKEPGQYGGYPVIPLRQDLKAKASMVHLPELRKQMKRVLRKLFPEEFS